MTARTTFGIVENDTTQGSTVGIRHVDLVAANIDAKLTELTAFQTAYEAVIDGATRSETVNALEQNFAFAPPGVDAQRELKWLVSGVDGNGNAQRLTIPTADTAFVTPGGSDMVDGAEKSALVTAIEALWVSNADSPVVVTSIKLVGRTN